MDTIVNFRDLGGYRGIEKKKVKSNCFFRSGELYQLSDDDKAALSNTYNVKCVVDFRSQKEVVEKPDDNIKGIEFHNIDILKGFHNKSTSKKELFRMSGGDPGAEMALLYKEIVLDETAQDSYRQFFRLLLELDEGACLFHCYAGKDRTGLGAALILGILGVSYDDIVRDYLLTNKFRKTANAIILKEAKKNGASKEALKSIEVALCVDRLYLDSAKQAVDKVFGGFFPYVQGVLQISNDEIEAFRNKYLLA